MSNLNQKILNREERDMKMQAEQLNAQEGAQAVLNLLDMKRSEKERLEQITTSNNRELYSMDANGEPSIVKYFQPKFQEIYNKFAENVFVENKSHLMSLCLECIIPFCIWIRESSAKTNWIKSILTDNIDLRPEVRNGLSMIVIYTIAAHKAFCTKVDMFVVLQDVEYGLGIVNKTSLKIYNDPFQFFNFLKCCISGLIDAGKIPENERQNQV
jgi:hypothetical protein